MKIILFLIMTISISTMVFAQESALDNPFEFREIPTEPGDDNEEDFIDVLPPEPDIPIEPEEPTEPEATLEEKINALKGLNENDYLVGIINNVEIYFNTVRQTHKRVDLNKIEEELAELYNENN